MLLRVPGPPGFTAVLSFSRPFILFINSIKTYRSFALNKYYARGSENTKVRVCKTSGNKSQLPITTELYGGSTWHCTVSCPQGPRVAGTPPPRGRLGLRPGKRGNSPTAPACGRGELSDDKGKGHFREVVQSEEGVLGPGCCGTLGLTRDGAQRQGCRSRNRKGHGGHGCPRSSGCFQRPRL